MTSLFGKAISNIGTFFKLPEFGVSEKFGYTPPAGSYGGPPATQTPSQSNISPQAQGFFNFGGQSGKLVSPIPSSYVQQTNVPSGGGGQPTGQVLGAQAPQEQTPGAPDVNALEALIQPALDTLSSLEAETRSLLGGGEAEATAFGSAAGAKATEAKQAGLATVGTQEAKSTARAGEAESQQKRGFAEIAQQFLGRFGRTGFGQGVTGALGESTLQNIGRIRVGLQETINELNVRRNQLEDVFNSAIQETNFQVENLKNQARQSLQSALAEIGSRRAELQTRRAELVNRALEMYRQNVLDINARNTQFQQQLYAQREATNERIREAQARATQNLATLPSFELSPGQTKFIPASQLGGQEGLSQFEGTTLPGGATFGQAGQYGVFSGPAQAGGLIDPETGEPIGQ